LPWYAQQRCAVATKEVNHQDRCRDFPVRTSLSRYAASAPADQNTIDGLAARAWHQSGGVYFSKAALERMPSQSREIIEAEAKNLYGKRER